ncbi:MAG TPA: triose-phosphate isomerase [Gammaproteobacteria bacterium]|nr:triose-phosphate isomerase [Gammaproteobacteria bacterium]
MRKILVAGNWKLNGSLAGNETLVKGILDGMGEVAVDVAVCPPYPYLPQVSALLDGSAVKLGSQDNSEQDKGAFTGEVSAAMLKEVGCHYAIVGHSERRSLFGETDEVTAKKFAAAQAAGLMPILCVGELLEERENGTTEEVVARQLDAVTALVGIDAMKDSVVAYEPVWAIGTGKTASPEQAQAVHEFIRSRLAAQNESVAGGIQILYGGSVKPDNAAELFAKPDIDGGLIGGASLNADDFLGICTAAK